MPSSQQTPHSAFESGGKSVRSAPSELRTTAAPTTHRTKQPENWAAPPRPKYETDPADLEEQPGHVVTESPEAVLPIRRYVPGVTAVASAPTQPLRFARRR